MKTTLSPPSPTTPLKQDPFQRLSLAVKKLDQLINRTHQLSTCTKELLREETTRPKPPSPETALTQSSLLHSSITIQAPEEMLEK